MGRWSKGVAFTNSSIRLEIDSLRKKGFLKKNALVQGIITWSNGGKIALSSHNYKGELHLELNYTLTYYERKTECNYRIEVVYIPSNLGKGEIYYFVCPVSGRKARILYSSYGSPRFMHRDEYARRGCRIYYPVQTSSKFEYHNDRYWEIERQTIPKLNIKRGKKHYKGKPTRRDLKLQKAYRQMEYFDRERWNPKNLPKSCLPFLSIYYL